MKNWYKNMVIAAIIAIISLATAGCNNSSSNEDDNTPLPVGGTGTTNGNLLAKWYKTQDEADTGETPTGATATPYYEFQAQTWKMLVGNQDSRLTFTATDSKIMTYSTSHNNAYVGEVSYVIEGTKLTITNASVISGILNGIYYKSSN